MTDKKHCSQCGKTLTEFEIATGTLHKGHPMAGMCGDCKFKYTEQKHGTAQAELDRIRAKARERNWRFMEKKRSEGSRQLSAIISKEGYDTLTRLRDAAQRAGTATSFGEIIEKALTCYVSTIERKGDTASVCRDDRINKAKIEPDAQGDVSKPVEHQTEIPGPDPAPDEKQEPDTSKPAIVKVMEEGRAVMAGYR